MCEYDPGDSKIAVGKDRQGFWLTLCENCGYNALKCLHHLKEFSVSVYEVFTSVLPDARTSGYRDGLIHEAAAELALLHMPSKDNDNLVLPILADAPFEWITIAESLKTMPIIARRAKFDDDEEEDFEEDVEEEEDLEEDLDDDFDDDDLDDDDLDDFDEDEDDLFEDDLQVPEHVKAHVGREDRGFLR